jgi:hypothetical protein
LISIITASNSVVEHAEDDIIIKEDDDDNGEVIIHDDADDGEVIIKDYHHTEELDSDENNDSELVMISFRTFMLCHLSPFIRRKLASDSLIRVFFFFFDNLMCIAF